MKKDKIFLKILPSIASLLILASVTLYFLAEKSMVVYRDLMYRNDILNETLLSNGLLGVYKIIALVSIVISIFLFIKFRNSLPKGHLYYIISPIIVGVILYFMINLYNTITWVSYPWMILSVIIKFLVENIRMIYSIKFLKKY